MNQEIHSPMPQAGNNSTPSPPPAKPAVSAAGGSESEPDKICWSSPDGQVVIRQKVRDAKRYSRHNYLIIVLELRPAPGTRIRLLDDGNEGGEALLTHQEVEQHVTALNLADPKVQYQVSRSIPPKDEARKAYWRKVQEKRFRRRKK